MRSGLPAALLVLLASSAFLFAQAKPEQLPAPGYVLIFVSDGSFPCLPCERFDRETLNQWRRNGWPVGEKASDWLRLVKVSENVPRFEIWREGRKVAVHRGYQTSKEFEAWTKRFLPEWHDPEWIHNYKQQVAPRSAPPPAKAEAARTWDYQNQFWLGN